MAQTMAMDESGGPLAADDLAAVVRARPRTLLDADQTAVTPGAEGVLPTAGTPCYRFTCPIGQPGLDVDPGEVVAAVEALAGLSLGDGCERREVAA